MIKSVFWRVFILSFVLSFILFGNSIFGDFVFDDVAVVQNRADLKDSGNFFNLFISSYHQHMPKTGLYRPLTMATYAINHVVFSSSPVSFHIFNIIIHALNSFLVFWLVDYFLRSKKMALISFGLFIAHPLHTEAVTSIVGRAELLAFFWSLMTIFYFSRNNKVMAAISFLLAMMSKEVALAVLPIIFYMNGAFLNKGFRKTIKESVIFIFPIAIYAVLRFLALGKYFINNAQTTLIENQLKFSSFPERIFTALKVLSLYLWKLIWPVHLSADYSYNSISIVSNIFLSPAALLGALAILSLVFIIAWKKTRRRGLALSAAMFLVPYLVISNLLFPIGTIMGERLIYSSSLGFVLAVAIGLNSMISRKNLVFKNTGYLLLIFLMGFYGVLTHLRNKDWGDSKTLFYATAKESPNSLITRVGLAALHIRANKWEEAKEELTVAQKIYEDDSRLQNLLGVVADHEGNFKLAEEKYKRSIALNPDAINSHINLAELYLKHNQFKEAGDNFLKVIEFHPLIEHVVRFGYIQITLGNPDGALDVLEKHMGREADHSDLAAMAGTAYFVKKDYQQALAYLKKARELGHKASEIEEMIKIAETR
ncbi:MAG: tetratricopeptide repeat protein [bacterium]|nr:tetratricopeptide repeat protein [bacterium]